MAGTFPVKSFPCQLANFRGQQDQPKSVKTATIHEPAPGLPNLTVIDEDDAVRIDWPVVETLAASKSGSYRPATGTIDAGDQGGDVEAGAVMDAKGVARRSCQRPGHKNANRSHSVQLMN
jgi:hypothetical protein